MIPVYKAVEVPVASGTAGVGGCERLRMIFKLPPGVAGGGDMAKGVATLGAARVAELGVRSLRVTGREAFKGGGGEAITYDKVSFE